LTLVFEFIVFSSTVLIFGWEIVSLLKRFSAFCAQITAVTIFFGVALPKKFFEYPYLYLLLQKLF
jgi:hypothetical protein